MAIIFVRERRHIGKGAGRPRYAVVAIQGSDLKVYAPHLRKAELEAMAASIEAQVVYLPRGEKAGQEEGEGEGGGEGRGRRSRWARQG